jgi:serine protease Do
MVGSENTIADMQQTHATLQHLSGNAIGTETWLSSSKLYVSLDENRLLNFSEIGATSGEGSENTNIATLSRTGGTYKLETAGDLAIWVNGRQVDGGELINGDIIEFGEKGPLSRFRLIDSDAHSRRYFSEICVDCWDYLRSSRKPLPYRMASTFGSGMNRLATQTTLLFRGGVVATLLLLGFATYQQHNINVLQQEHLANDQVQLMNFSSTLALNKREAVTSSDLNTVRDKLSRDLSQTLGRLEALEERSIATETVIGNSTHSVAFLQGAYGFHEVSTGRPMRHLLGPGDLPLTGPGGRPILTLEGDGPIAERRYTGTGFAIADGTVLVTNRHVAVPWMTDGSADLVGSNLEPFMIKLIAYVPGSPDGRDLELIIASETADLALIQLVSPESPLPPLRIADSDEAQGAAVIVMGYPTGLNSMLARSGKVFVEELQREKETDFWLIARRLADKGYIKPLSSLGIVAQATSEFLVYDAATTRGGSGGPVLNARGEVVAVNAAILPDYAGSNFGVPWQQLRELIEQAGVGSSIDQTQN